jgi:hypothetical protein
MLTLHFEEVTYGDHKCCSARLIPNMSQCGKLRQVVELPSGRTVTDCYCQAVPSSASLFSVSHNSKLGDDLIGIEPQYKPFTIYADESSLHSQPINHVVFAEV